MQTGIVLQVATNPTVDISLKIGAVNEQVQVEANAALVETQATGVGNVMETQRILELPLNGRVATDLIQYTGGSDSSGRRGQRRLPRHRAVRDRRRTGLRRRVLAGWQRVQQSVGSGEHAASFPRRAAGVQGRNQLADGAKRRARRRYRHRRHQDPAATPSTAMRSSSCATAT